MGFQGLEIARSGMAVNERALTVSSHNISNVNTKGYSRQQAITQDSMYASLSGGKFQVGYGAEMQETRQIRDGFLDSIYRNENMSFGYWDTRKKAFKDVESILGDPMSTGLMNVENQFWDSWQELSKDPSSLTVRALVRQRSQDLVDQLNNIGSQLNKLQANLDNEIATKINEVNDASKRISELNMEILKAESWGDKANDYRDERNNLIDKLKYLCNVEVNEQNDGQVDVTLSGYVLVSKSSYHKLSIEKTPESGTFNEIKIDYAKESVPISNGYIKGLFEARGEVYGAEDSVANGYPNTKADIVVAVDLSNSSPLYMDKMKASITSYVDELDRRGIDANLRLVTYSGAAVVDNQNFAADFNGFIDKIRSLSTTGDGFGNFENAIDDIVDSTQFRKDANRYAFVFSGESISGDENFVDNATTDAIKDKLVAGNIKTIIAAPSMYNDQGTPADPLGIEIEAGWKSIATATGGTVIDVNTQTDFKSFFKEVSDFINTDINAQISDIKIDNNILPYAMKKLNAFANILLREINYLHSGGRTFGSTTGQATDFFVPINNAYSLKLGNIRLNPNIDNINYISASGTDAQGDNTIAVGISNLRHAKLLKDDKGMLDVDEYYQMFLMDAGTRSSEAAKIAENQKKLVDSADINRQGIMGVSMDEEMSMVLKYKFAYNASSRALNVVNEMMDIVINKMGTVGR